MNIELQKEEIYSFSIGALKLPGLKIVSKWNDLTEFRTLDGRKLIMLLEKSGNTFSDIFGDIFASCGDGGKNPALIICGTSSLINEISLAMQQEQTVPDVAVDAGA